MTASPPGEDRTPVVVATSAGQVEGHHRDGIAEFLGIPYAAAPTGRRRFTAPARPEPWDGVRPVHAYAPVSPQVPTYGPVGTAAMSALDADEGPLTLNVRTPDVGGGAPVIVWVHGGGYAVGSGSEAVLRSGAFARSGVVEVTPNYRLGAIGLLYLGDGQPANRGLLDLIAVLEWVRDNITRFGGDPSRVTLAGRSAGGFAVATLMAMPAARGLFRYALVQSGASPAHLPVPTAERITDLFCKELSVSRDELPGVPIARLLQAQKVLCDDAYTHHRIELYGEGVTIGLPFQPVVDGLTLPDAPESAVAGGSAAGVTMLIGTTTGEAVTHATVHGDLSDDDVIRLVRPRIQAAGADAVAVAAGYRDLFPAASGKALWTEVIGDLVFQLPSNRFAAAQSAHGTVYKYLYGDAGPAGGGVPHGGEVGDIWRSPDGPSPDLPERFQPRHPPLADRVHEAWVSFVVSGVPAADGWPAAPVFDPGDPRLLHIAPAATVVEADRYHQRLRLWT
jgi:para-nitrobenzyl esterase